MELCFGVEEDVSLVKMDGGSFRHLTLKTFLESFDNFHLDDTFVSCPLRMEVADVLGKGILLIIVGNSIPVFPSSSHSRVPTLSLIGGDDVVGLADSAHPLVHRPSPGVRTTLETTLTQIACLMVDTPSEVILDEAPG